MSDKLIPNYKRRKEIVQPHITRSRAAHRAPFKSEDIQLEMDQIRFDLTNLRAQLETLRNDMEAILDDIVEGRLDTGDPNFSNFVSMTLDQIFAKVQEYEKRISDFEARQGLKRI